MRSATGSCRADPRAWHVGAASGMLSDEVAILHDALEALWKGHPELRGAEVYPVARLGVIVRLYTAGGWIPALLGPHDRRDTPALIRRLESALVEDDRLG